MKLSPGKNRAEISRKTISAPLSQELREKHGRRSFPVRKGDTVKILRGDFTGIEGKVNTVDTDRGRLFVEGLTRDKVSGTSTLVTIHSSKVVITNLNLSDKWRADALESPDTRSSAEETPEKEAVD